MTACTEQGCDGTIAPDGYCDTCGMAASAAGVGAAGSGSGMAASAAGVGAASAAGVGAASAAGVGAAGVGAAESGSAPGPVAGGACTEAGCDGTIAADGYCDT